jgi:2-haloacid dehalogenase
VQRVLVFDVNETLLDVAALDPLFGEMFGDTAVRREWFGQMLQSAFVSTITGDYRDFGALAMGALSMVGERHGRTISDDHRAGLRDGMRRLPPHPEVREALQQLRSAGYRLATLTNSTSQVGQAQLANAELQEFFEQMLSADDVRRLKPAREPYRMVAEHMGVDINEIRLVAAHSWDVAGALSAGCAAAFVARPGQVLDPSAGQPDIVGANLLEIADRIIEVDR